MTEISLNQTLCEVKTCPKSFKLLGRNFTPTKNMWDHSRYFLDRLCIYYINITLTFPTELSRVTKNGHTSFEVVKESFLILKLEGCKTSSFKCCPRKDLIQVAMRIYERHVYNKNHRCKSQKLSTS